MIRTAKFTVGKYFSDGKSFRYAATQKIQRQGTAKKGFLIFYNL